MADKALLPNQTIAPNNEWRTPEPFFGLVSRELGPFQLDAAADLENALAPFCYTVNGLFRLTSVTPAKLSGEDGLGGTWTAYSPAGTDMRVWCNPPYGRELPKWVEKARGEARPRDGVTAVLLIPPSRNTRWWVEHVEGKAAEVRYLIGRIQFDAPPDRPMKPGDSNRYDSALVIYRPGYEKRGAGTHSWSWDWRAELPK